MDDAVRQLCLDLLVGRRSLDPSATPLLREYVEDFLGPDWIEEKLGPFDDWVEQESDRLFVWDDLDRPSGTNPLVAMLWAARKWEEIRRTDREFVLPRAARRFLAVAGSLAQTELHAGNLMDRRGREGFRARLRADDHAWGAIHESETFTTFLRWNAGPIPYFLSTGNPIDIELHWNGYAIPVHCKSKDPRSGRFLASEAMNRLAAAVAVADKLRGRERIIRICPPPRVAIEALPLVSRFAADLPDRTLAPIICKAGDAVYLVSSEPASMRLRRDELDGFLPDEDFYARLVVAEPVQGSDLVEVRSVVSVNANGDDTERASAAFKGSLSRAAGAISRGDRPGVAAIHYFDAHPAFGRSDTLPRWMSELLVAAFERHPKLAAVMISTEPEPWRPGASGGSGTNMKVRWARRESGLPDDFPFQVDDRTLTNPSQVGGSVGGNRR